MNKKLIEVALPLEAINEESTREKLIRRGHPSTFHLWWARRPLAACRAVLFAQLVDDPSARPDRFPDEKTQSAERQRLFRIIEELVRWENVNNATVLSQARDEIAKAVDGDPPTVFDPFAGGGSIPLEAQRLGLSAFGADLNPVATLITKGLVEIPAQFSGVSGVSHDEARLVHDAATTRSSLTKDVDFYARLLESKLRDQLRGFYPPVSGDSDLGPVYGATPIAYFWCRTIRCTNPACNAVFPLVNSWIVRSRPDRRVWVEPVWDADRHISFAVRSGEGDPREGTVGRQGARCVVCETAVSLADIRTAGRNGQLGRRMLAIVAEGERGRVYIAASESFEDAAKVDVDQGLLDSELPKAALGFRVQAYGLTKHRDLFTDRQLQLLEAIVELIPEIRARVVNDAVAAGLPADGRRLESGGRGADGYADAISVYVALWLGRIANRSSSQCFWHPGRETVEQVFARNALPMIWVSAEANPFSNSSGNALGQLGYLVDALAKVPGTPEAEVHQRDAAAGAFPSSVCISTDPPYYDNVPYADLSDFFYVWLRRAIGSILPDLFSTVLVPKAAELIAEPSRHANRSEANAFFERGLRRVFELVRESEDTRFPATVFYAFKQSEAVAMSPDQTGGVITGYTSTGWETMLQGLVDAGLRITGTWPIRTEQAGGLRQLGRNALASSIVLVVRPRTQSAEVTTRRQLVTRLRAELPSALRRLQEGNIAPVDLAQASIGPGMALFSEYEKVIEADGSSMRVRTALALINQVLSEVLQEQEGDFEPATRWAIAWFEQFGVDAGPYGDAELLSKAKNTAVQALVVAGILESRAGDVRLIPRKDLPAGWSPEQDPHLVVWKVLQRLVRSLEVDGELAAARLLTRTRGLADAARELAYRLYVICERKGWTGEALAYNGLVVAWPELLKLASHSAEPEQDSFGI